MTSDFFAEPVDDVISRVVDVDFCHAVRMVGRKVLFTPAAEITHLRGRSRASAPQASRAKYRQSQIAFYEKHHPLVAPLLRLYLYFKREL